MVKKYLDVEEYKFQSFSDQEVESDKVVLFEFKQLLSHEQLIGKNEFQKNIKIERTHAKNSLFKFNPIVEKYRGLQDQEEQEYQDRVAKDVEKRVSELYDGAYTSGFDEGVLQGREIVFKEMRNVVDQKLDLFSQMVSDVLKTQEEILNVQKKEIYLLLKNLTKWIINRELQDDGKYVERLLERLLLESQARSNLLIQVNSSDFADMPEILKHIESRLGEMKNVRVEIDSSILTKGMTIESDNGIINATMEEQFKSLDKLFADVLVDY